MDVATVWQRSARNGPYDGCSGISLATATGPGGWVYPLAYDIDSQVPITGASYIKMPLVKPTDKEAPWLHAQGIFGLVTGKWIWTDGRVNEAAVARMRGYMGTLSSEIGKHFKRVKRKVERKVIGGEEGIVLLEDKSYVIFKTSYYDIYSTF